MHQLIFCLNKKIVFIQFNDKYVKKLLARIGIVDFRQKSAFCSLTFLTLERIWRKVRNKNIKQRINWIGM